MIKTAIQLVLFIFLIVILSVVFYNYFYDAKETEKEKIILEIPKIKLVEKEKIDAKEELFDSEINNLTYKKFDIQNNVYLIKALKGVIKNSKPNIVIMTDVSASITYGENDKLFILSKNAIFNKKTFETNFKNSVQLTYKDHKLDSDNLDLSFNKNIAIFRDNVRYQNLDTKMFSNKIIVNLLNKEIEITGNDKVVIESRN